MAKARKRRAHASPEQIRAMVETIDAYLAEHPGDPIAVAHRAVNAQVPIKNYYAYKRRQGHNLHGVVKGTDIPLDAIPERHSGRGGYKRKVRTAVVDPQTQTAIDLLKMALRILEAR